jgi:hypothetical protein
VPISGATSRSYTLTSSDAGHALVVYVTATNAAGSTGPVNSKPSDVVSEAAPPKFATQPSITGKAQVGEALAVKVGTFTGGNPTKLAFQWQLCDKTGQACADITGATSQTFGVRSGDVGHTLVVKVTASNAYGTATATSAATGVVTSIPQPVVATTTISASRAVTTCCQTIRLSGQVSTQQSGVTVTILAREVDHVYAEPVTVATTDSSGTWAAVVRPSVKTTYTAQVGSSPAAGVTVKVRPRVGLGTRGRHWTVKVSARDSFAGALVLVQRRVGSHWATVGRVVLGLNSSGHLTLRRSHARWTVRAIVPGGQLGLGYLTGISQLRSIRI